MGFLNSSVLWLATACWFCLKCSVCNLSSIHGSNEWSKACCIWMSICPYFDPNWQFLPNILYVFLHCLMRFEYLGMGFAISRLRPLVSFPDDSGVTPKILAELGKNRFLRQKANFENKTLHQSIIQRSKNVSPFHGIHIHFLNTF